MGWIDTLNNSNKKMLAPHAVDLIIVVLITVV